MNKTEAENIMMMRYACIIDAVNQSVDDLRSKREIIESASEKGVEDRNSGTRRYFAVPTITRWYRIYQKLGLDGLKPQRRSDCKSFRKIDDEIYNQIMEIKKQYPRISATAIRKRLINKGFINQEQISLSTINRCVNTIKDKLDVPTEIQEMKRYEMEHINEVWCGDSSVGPYITIDGVKRKIWIQALIDDASRYIVGINAFLNDNYENFLGVVKSAVAKHGVPRVFNFDNGSTYKNRQVELLAARIGSRINWNKPYTPTSKGKIERFFKTMKIQWLAEFNPSNFHSLEDVRNDLFKYVNKYNNTPHSSLEYRTPQDRFFKESSLIRKLSDDSISRNFLMEIERRVTRDGLVSISNRMFEVDNQYCRKKVTLRYTADLSDVYIVENEGNTLTPVKLLNKHENSRVKRKVYISSPAAETPASGQADVAQSASGTTSSTANNNIG